MEHVFLTVEAGCGLIRSATQVFETYRARASSVV
jgi:hypothetical protein